MLSGRGYSKACSGCIAWRTTPTRDESL